MQLSFLLAYWSKFLSEMTSLLTIDLELESDGKQLERIILSLIGKISSHHQILLFIPQSAKTVITCFTSKPFMNGFQCYTP